MAIIGLNQNGHKSLPGEGGVGTNPSTPICLMSGDTLNHTPEFEEEIFEYGGGHAILAPQSVSLALFDMTLSVESAFLVAGPFTWTDSITNRIVRKPIEASSRFVLTPGNTYAIATKCDTGNYLFYANALGASEQSSHTTLTGSYDFPAVWETSKNSSLKIPTYFATRRTLATRVNVKKYTDVSG